MGCGHHGGGLLGFKKFGLVFRRKFQGLFHEPGLASRLASAGAPCDSAQGTPTCAKTLPGRPGADTEQVAGVRLHQKFPEQFRNAIYYDVVRCLALLLFETQARERNQREYRRQNSEFAERDVAGYSP
jgi:hypothetical protein